MSSADRGKWLEMEGVGKGEEKLREGGSILGFLGNRNVLG